jgi:hypothetical protein
MIPVVRFDEAIVASLELRASYSHPQGVVGDAARSCTWTQNAAAPG